MSQHELRRQICGRLAEALRSGTVPWRQPWSGDVNCGPPTNPLSRQKYGGVNVLLLNLAAQERGYRPRWWGTNREWRELGGQVRRGEQPTVVIDGDEAALKRVAVFNLNQVEGKSLQAYRPGWPRREPYPDVLLDWTLAREAVAATGADIGYGGDAAYYSRPVGGEWPNHADGDHICVPESHRYYRRADRYSVLFHELTHWSEVRLGLEGTYAFGELRAEIAACFCLAELGLPQSEDLVNHNTYLRAWLRAMDDDPRYIIRAATEASRATDYVLSFSREHRSVEGEPTVGEAVAEV